MGTLLIAGPLALDEIANQPNTIGGVGGYAAIAAASLATTQLWCRGGSEFTPYLQGLLTQKGIDLSGVSWDGPTPRGTPQGFVAGGPILPELEPTEAEDLGAVLLIGLPPEEFFRAARVVAALPGAESRTVVVSPRPSDLLDANFLGVVANTADLLVLSVTKAQEITRTKDPLAAAKALQAAGAKSVVLTARHLGGLIAYRGKITTYPALPLETIDAAGVSAAFPGALAAWCAGAGKGDFATVKRGCAVASAVAGICSQGQGPRKLLQANRNEIIERFNRLRREQKY